MSTYYYHAFDMQIQSDFELSLPSIEEGGSTSHILEIIEGNVPLPAELPFVLGSIRYGMEENCIIFDIPWSARYRIEGSSRIVVEPIPNVGIEWIDLYITNFLLTIVLSMRGIATLHGSAISRDGKGIIFLGKKGAGKSTIAAKMALSGYEMLCDDAIPVSPDGMIFPGIPYPKLLSDAFSQLIGQPSNESRLFDGVSKYRVELPSSRIAVPLSIIFILKVAPQDSHTELTIEPLTGVEKFQAVLSNSVSFEGVVETETLFQNISKWLPQKTCYCVLRPSDIDCLQELMDIVWNLQKHVVF